jgi:hypothetical protein
MNNYFRGSSTEKGLRNADLNLIHVNSETSNIDLTCPEPGGLIYDSSDVMGVAMGFLLRGFLDWVFRYYKDTFINYSILFLAI